MVVLFLAPALLLYLGLFIYPAMKAFYLSLFDWDGLNAKQYIGFENFVELFKDKQFWNVSMLNTVRIVFVGGAFIFLLAFILSGILSTRISGRKFFRGFIFFPAIICPVAISIMWNFIYDYDHGLLNSLLRLVGLDRIALQWQDDQHLFWSILAAIIWMYTGWFCVILLAALDRVPQGLLEAASIEGATEGQIFVRIKLPLISEIMVTSFILWGIIAIKEFALLFSWGGGISEPRAGATNLGVLMYVAAFGRRTDVYRYGYSTAMGVIMFVMIVVIVSLISKLGKKDALEY
jgi:ABC-type sugar transport system permease subunit